MAILRTCVCVRATDSVGGSSCRIRWHVSAMLWGWMFPSLNPNLSIARQNAAFASSITGSIGYRESSRSNVSSPSPPRVAASGPTPAGVPLLLVRHCSNCCCPLVATGIRRAVEAVRAVVNDWKDNIHDEWCVNGSAAAGSNAKAKRTFIMVEDTGTMVGGGGDRHVQYHSVPNFLSVTLRRSKSCDESRTKLFLWLRAGRHHKRSL
jgi:hypothetical protein